MRVRIAGSLAAALVAALVVLAARPAAALACSADAEWDPVANSDVILGGQIVRWEADPAAVRGPGSYITVRLNVRIDHVWKGAVAGARIVDRASLLLLPTGPQPAPTDVRLIWGGAGGACGAVDADPTGWYAVFGLDRDADGTLRTNRLTTFYLAPDPYDSRAIPRLTPRLGLPVTGGGPDSDDEPTRTAALLLAGAGVFLLRAGVRRPRPTEPRPPYRA